MSNKKWIIFTLILFIITINIIFLSLIFLNISSPEEVKSNIREEVYIISYVGDIDGEVSEDWFFFYKKLIKFYEKNEIPVSFSFYASSIMDDSSFNKLFLRMYKSKYIELIQKGYKGDELEMRMDSLPFEKQKSIIKAGQDQFRKKITEISKIDYVKLPVVYNQINAKFTNDTKIAAEELGFIFYFDVYYDNELELVSSTNDFDVIQYGVGFTRDGDAGPESIFRSPEDIFNEINNFSREDIKVMILDGKKVLPLWVHQQDFESMENENKLDKEKWKVYEQVINALKKDPNVHLTTPDEIYKLRRSSGILYLD